MRITVVVPRKDLGDEDRNRIQAFQRARIPDVPYVTGTYEHDDPSLWSMSRAVNVGAALAGTPGLLLTPADYVLRPEDVATAEAMLDVLPWVGMFAGTHVLTHEATQRVLAEGRIGVSHLAHGRRLGCCVPCVAVRADVFADVGGMDPRFAGWGPEDVVLRHKLHVLYGPPPTPVAEVVIELAAPGSGVWGAAGYTGPTPNRAANDALCSRWMSATTPTLMRALIAEQLGSTK